jgi:FkbM family methyltransferase
MGGCRRFSGVIRKLVNRLGYDVVRYPNRLGFEYHLSQLIDYLQIDTVLDVGANHGQYATSLRSLGYDGWIYSYEPVKTIFDSLSARMTGDDRWRGFNFALGDAEDRKPINVAAGDGQASSFLTFNDEGPERWGDAHRVARMEEVEVHRLDRVISEITKERPDARIHLKLDTQGLDLTGLRSAGDMIPLIHGLQAEIAVNHFYEGMVPLGDAINTYQELGFEITGVFPLSREFDKLRIIEFDFVFMRHGRNGHLPG